MPLVSINPANKQKIAEYSELDQAAIESKLQTAHQAFLEWHKTSFAERSKLMQAAATELRTRKSDLAKLAANEMGKTLAAGQAEVEKCALACDFYAENSEKFLSPEKVETDASDSYARFDPIGVVLAVMPWNFPYWQVFRFAAPALMAGNAGVLKHASNVQGCAQAIEEVFKAAGFPDGLFINLPIGSAKVEAVIRSPLIAAVTLTGSEKAGSAVAKVAGQEIKKTVLELGGSDPFIVMDDADIDAAVTAAVTARMQFNSGQSCIAAKRFIIHESVVQVFSDKLVSAVEKLKLGDPLDPQTDMGPLTNEQMQKDIERQVNESVAKGAKILAGGQRGNDDGYYFQPTVLGGVTTDMPAFNEELFGPVFPIIIFNDEAEAVKLANSSIYGLGSTVFGKDTDKIANEIAPQIESGAVFINGPVKSDPRLPFGGVKKSGYGRELSSYGIKEFVNIKTVWAK
jgi:succinate-semialdehyde dehydrogenase/glutarate-semialdehyde dehydrogenase